MEIDHAGILEVLPHRYPFLLVDRILECDGEKRIVGLKNITFNEPYFQGHFPGEPIMPGVLQLEAMAQVGGILMNKVTGKEGAIAYFMAVDKVKFRRLIRPGDQLRIEIDVIKARSKVAKVKATVFLGENGKEVVSEGELTFGVYG